jgi:transcriptional regulator with XRE-family HTH domain
MGSREKSKGKHIQVNWVVVGRRIREIRGFDMTQGEFAERIGISQNHLSTMERGKVEIGAEILLRISRTFGKSLEWLLTGEG